MNLTHLLTGDTNKPRYSASRVLRGACASCGKERRHVPLLLLDPYLTPGFSCYRFHFVCLWCMKRYRSSVVNLNRDDWLTSMTLHEVNEQPLAPRSVETPVPDEET